jgi:hypothetical protein
VRDPAASAKQCKSCGKDCGRPQPWDCPTCLSTENCERTLAALTRLHWRSPTPRPVSTRSICRTCGTTKPGAEVVRVTYKQCVSAVLRPVVVSITTSAQGWSKSLGFQTTSGCASAAWSPRPSTSPCVPAAGCRAYWRCGIHRSRTTRIASLSSHSRPRSCGWTFRSRSCRSATRCRIMRINDELI